MSNGCFGVGGIVVENVCGASVGHERLVNGDVKVLYISEASKDLSNMVFGDIFRQFFDDNLGAFRGAGIGTQRAASTSAIIVTGTSTATARSRSASGN